MAMYKIDTRTDEKKLTGLSSEISTISGSGGLVMADCRFVAVTLLLASHVASCTLRIQNVSDY